MRDELEAIPQNPSSRQPSCISMARPPYATMLLDLYPNIANLLPAKTVKLAPEHAICALARLGQDLTYGQVRFVLPQTARGHIWCTLARFSSAQVCNVRVNISRISGSQALYPHQETSTRTDVR